MYQLGMQINTLPLQLVLASTGHVGIARAANFVVLYSYTADERITCCFDENGFTVNGKEFLYNTFYVLAENDELKEWLKSEQLNAPWHEVFEDY